MSKRVFAFLTLALIVFIGVNADTDYDDDSKPEEPPVIIVVPAKDQTSSSDQVPDQAPLFGAILEKIATVSEDGPPLKANVSVDPKSTESDESKSVESNPEITILNGTDGVIVVEKNVETASLIGAKESDKSDESAATVIAELNAQTSRVNGSQGGVILGEFTDEFDIQQASNANASELEQPRDFASFIEILRPILEKAVEELNNSTHIDSDNQAFNATDDEIIIIPMVDVPSANLIPFPSNDDKPYGPTFCNAQCLATCYANNGSQCTQSCSKSFSEACGENDAACWRNCNVLMRVDDKAPKAAPSFTKIVKDNDDSFMKETIHVEWTNDDVDQVYVVELIPNPTSMLNGATLNRHIVNVPWYKMEKSFGDSGFCLEYYIRVAAVNPYGWSQFSDSELIANSAPQLPLNIQLGDTFVTDIALLDTIDYVMPHYQLVLRMDNIMSTNPKTSLDLKHFDFKFYLLASECSNPVGSLFTDLQDTSMPNGVYKINDVALYTAEKSSLWFYLPKDVLLYDCLYTFRVTSVTNTCGKVAYYASDEGNAYDSTIGFDARLNCDTVRNSQCTGGQQNEEQRNADPEELMTTLSPDAIVPIGDNIICQLQEFDAAIVGGGKNRMNVNVSFNAIGDDTSVYYMRYGFAERQLFVESLDDIQFQYVESKPNVSDDVNSYQKVISLPFLRKDVLHSVQICLSQNGDSPNEFDWLFAPKHILDLTAKVVSTKSENDPTGTTNNPSTDENSADEAGEMSLEDDANIFRVEIKPTSDHSQISWSIIVESLFVALFCLLMAFVILHRRCNRRRKQLALKEVAVQEKPIAVIVA